MDLLEKVHNAEEEESILSSIHELSIDYGSGDQSISMNLLGYIWYVSQIHPDINARYAILKIRDRIKQTQNEWKVALLSAKVMGKVLHKLFKAAVNELDHALLNLG